MDSHWDPPNPRPKIINYWEMKKNFRQSTILMRKVCPKTVLSYVSLIEMRMVKSGGIRSNRKYSVEENDSEAWETLNPKMTKFRRIYNKATPFLWYFKFARL